MLKKLKYLFCFLTFLPLFNSSLFSQSKINISFGSCLNSKKEMGILKSIKEFSPDYFIFLGDNIYKDSLNIEDKAKEYEKLGENNDFRAIKQNSKIYATWDDHDYGINDSGEEYTAKIDSQREFLRFFYPDKLSEKMKSKGVYSSEEINFKKLKIQLIILDTRYFRTSLLKKYYFFGPYVSNYDSEATILGKEQWIWLEDELNKISDLTLIVSSIQFHNEDHGFEKWSNFPLEKEKLFHLLKKSKKENVIILSGDRHISESFIIDGLNLKNFYEITSSPLNNELPFRVPFNKRADRVGELLYDSSFGNIEISDKNNKYYFEFSYILKNLNKVIIPINNFIIQK